MCSGPVMRIGLWYGFALLLVASSLALAGPEYFVRVEADAFAAPVSIHAFTDDWHDKLEHGHIAFLDSDAEVGFRDAQSTLSLVRRYDYLLHFTDDTARIYYQYKNQLPPDVGRNYPLEVRLRHVESKGVRYAYNYKSEEPDRLQVDVGLSLLQGLQLTDGELTGNAEFLSPTADITSIQSLVANIDYHYSQPALHEQRLGWNPDAPDGYGYSLDLALRARLGEHWHLNASLLNVLGEMYWSRVPVTHYVVTCQCYLGSYRTNGVLQYDDHFNQQLPLVGRSELRYEPGQSWYLVAGAFYNPLVLLGSAGVGYRYGIVQTQLSVEPQTHSLSFRYEHRHIGLRWQADTLNFNKAHRLGADIYAHYRW